MVVDYKEVRTELEAKQASNFLLKPDNFGSITSSAEQEDIRSQTKNSLKNEHQKFWLALVNTNIVGVVGICENKVKSSGYFLDWFAVEEKHRSKGIGSNLIQLAETFVKDNKGRYITIDTGDNDKYIAARKFYEKHNYIKVGHVPNYYSSKCGKIDYYKDLT